jgi:hypothetical protein
MTDTGPDSGRVVRARTNATPPPSQALVDAVTQLEANKTDVSPKGFQKRLQLAYAIFDQAGLMVQEIETQHATLVEELMGVERRTPLPTTRPSAPSGRSSSRK